MEGRVNFAALNPCITSSHLLISAATFFRRDPSHTLIEHKPRCAQNSKSTAGGSMMELGRGGSRIPSRSFSQ
eukprot:51294-Amphidinium_carterae.1